MNPKSDIVYISSHGISDGEASILSVCNNIGEITEGDIGELVGISCDSLEVINKEKLGCDDRIDTFINPINQVIDNLNVKCYNDTNIYGERAENHDLYECESKSESDNTDIKRILNILVREEIERICENKSQLVNKKWSALPPHWWMEEPEINLALTKSNQIVVHVFSLVKTIVITNHKTVIAQNIICDMWITVECFLRMNTLACSTIAPKAFKMKNQTRDSVECEKTHHKWYYIC